ncbi:MAG: methyl-accepting chemotaxis protein [Sporomusaceae bacterium]|nr:methyl-accepting chemotaxis protein [Sporomusaceae bacterium]
MKPSIKSSIKSRLFIWFILAAVIPMIVIGGFSYYLISQKIAKQNEETITNINTGIYNMVDTQQKVLSRWLESADASFVERLNSLGNSRFDYDNMVDIGGYRLPTWYIGNQKITDDSTLVDSLIGKEKLPATIFQLHNNKFIRVSTNVRQPDGSRISGTYIDSGNVYERLINGQQYLGRASVEGIMHATIYQPIWDSSGKLIGAFVLGRREQEYEMIAAIKNIVVGETGYAFILDPSGMMIIHPTLQGKNALEYPWVKEIIQKKNGSVTYDFNGRTKIAYFMYYEPWNWYIVTGSYESEIFNTTHQLSKMLILAILVVVAISSSIALLLSNTFFKPINELMIVMRQCQSGNLTVRLKHFSDDEFSVLGNAFNVMLNNISLLIGRILSNSTKLKEASQRLLIDITESKDALQGIEKGVKDLQGDSIPLLQSYAFASNKALHTEFQETVHQLNHLLEQIMLNKQLDKTEEALHLLKKISTLCQANPIVSPSDYQKTPEAAIHPMNQISHLEVEVEKLKLLLKNISSSASSLDDIALSLDRHVNSFKIEKDE